MNERIGWLVTEPTPGHCELRDPDDVLRFSGDAKTALAQWAFAQSTIAALAAERDKLRAVVAKLPKDGDGNPVVPSDERWTLEGKHVRVGMIEDDVIGLVHVGFADWRRDGEDEWGEYADELYSTREAAEAAQAEKDNDHD